MENFITELDDFAEGHSLEPYFNFAGSQGIENKISDKEKDDFWKKLCTLKEYLFRLKSKLEENYRLFHGVFMPELYNEYFRGESQVWIKCSDWKFDWDMLSFIKEYSEELKNNIGEALEKKAKAFIKKQGDDLKKVNSAKSQLYLYFLYLYYIKKDLSIDAIYSREGCMNFYSNGNISENTTQRIFEKNYTFVIYKQRVFNYNPIPIHTKLQDSDFLQKLQNWANEEHYRDC